VVPANYSVYIPVEYVKKTELLKYTKSSKIYVYMPRRRERVATIAKRLGIDVALIKRLNRLRRNVVYRGQALLLVKREGS
jgi:membrane-bound lytic murein transglycosylase D